MRKTILTVAIVLTVSGCAAGWKLPHKGGQPLTVSLEPGTAGSVPRLRNDAPLRDTLLVRDPEGKEVLIMRAVKDDNGEMVATDVIDAAVVTARFRHVAERQGKVEIGFDVHVPPRLTASRWQVRLEPVLHVLDERIPLDPVYVTGSGYRKTQLRGYQHYERFLAGILTDSAAFLQAGQLERFLERNLPEVYRFKGDSSYVADETFSSAFGVTQREALQHYVNRFARQRNDRRIARKDQMFARYVRAPLVTEGLRLDTVLADAGKGFTYRYLQPIQTRPGLRKALLTVGGAVFEQDKTVYTLPPGDSLTYYISSLSTLADRREKYQTAVLERNVAFHTACYIAFGAGSSEIEPDRAPNPAELGRIRRNILSLLERTEFAMDSVTATASCSPEGAWSVNQRLSRDRSAAVSAYLRQQIRTLQDSLRHTNGKSLFPEGRTLPDIRFRSGCEPENWEMLARLVERDSLLSRKEKEVFRRHAAIRDPDVREAALQQESSYRYLREHLYPRLRVVRLDFALHRIGMEKDTLHTTVLDTVYMRGVQALGDRDYDEAVRLLRPYNDYNTAVALCASGRNASALALLEHLERDDRTDYLRALLYSRQGDPRSAVQYYLDACAKNSAYVSRGNLDPEISELIAAYGLNRD